MNTIGRTRTHDHDHVPSDLLYSNNSKCEKPVFFPTSQLQNAIGNETDTSTPYSGATPFHLISLVN